MNKKQVFLEVLHEGKHWIPCEYMARVVESVASDYGESLHWEKVVTKTMAGAMRYGELSKHLRRPAPVPSIFIDGELVFEITPSTEELRKYLDGIFAKLE